MLHYQCQAPTEVLPGVNISVAVKYFCKNSKHKQLLGKVELEHLDECVKLNTAILSRHQDVLRKDGKSAGFIIVNFGVIRTPSRYWTSS